jgi:hypothetical protein
MFPHRESTDLEIDGNEIRNQYHKQELKFKLSPRRYRGLVVVWVDICYADNCAWSSELSKFHQDCSTSQHCLYGEELAKGPHIGWLEGSLTSTFTTGFASGLTSGSPACEISTFSLLVEMTGENWMAM